MKKKIKQFFCKHNWENISNMENPPPSTNKIQYGGTRLHKCDKCDKEEYIGMDISI